MSGWPEGKMNREGGRNMVKLTAINDLPSGNLLSSHQ